MDEMIRDLMHRTIDGEATDEERTRLHEILARDPAAMAEWEETGRLCRLLEHVQTVDPPGEWKQALLDRLRERAAKVKIAPVPHRSEGWFERIAAALRTRLSPSTGFAFAAGAVAGIALFVAWGPFQSSLPMRGDGSAPGTLLQSSRIEAGRLVGETRLEFEGARVHARALARGLAARVEIEVRSADAIDLEIEFDPGSLRVHGFDQEAPGFARIEATAGQVRIEHQGIGRYWLEFEGVGQGPVDLRIRLQSAEHQLERALPVLRDST